MNTITSRSTATVRFELAWNSGEVEHTDCVVMPSLNMWRDILPEGVSQGLLNASPGDAFSVTFRAGEMLTPWTEENLALIPQSNFNRHFMDHNIIEPRCGRFYPMGILEGLAGVFRANVVPVRVARVHASGLTVDFNHPLAGYDLTLRTIVEEVRERYQERGGLCAEVTEVIAGSGPGMQARWRGQATDFFSDEPFSRADSSPDEIFYATPRMVSHLDAVARGQIAGLYGRLLVSGMRILDLMSSWESHLPSDRSFLSVEGIGMNREEMECNRRLTTVTVHDVNRSPRLPYPDASFDGIICTASVEYLTKPLAVFMEAGRVLRPGGRFILTFSNRWFSPKVVRVWEEIQDFERLGLVTEYFLESGAFHSLATWSIRGLPRPWDDKYILQTRQSDPIYAIWGERK